MCGFQSLPVLRRSVRQQVQALGGPKILRILNLVLWVQKKLRHVSMK